MENTRHRMDGPAIKTADSVCAWFCNGLLHRVDSPALIFGDGTVDWHLHGLKCSKELFDFIVYKNHHRNLKKFFQIVLSN